jgi:hypothetical protein
MHPFNVMVLFCEDIREEKGDLVTLVGILPDNVGLTAIEVSDDKQLAAVKPSEKVLSKLCIYVRLNFDPDFDLGAVKVRLALPDGVFVELGSIEEKTVGKARVEAKKNGSPLAGVISRVVMGGFRPPRTGGVLKVEVQVRDEFRLGGFLNFQSKESSTSSNAAELPS